MIGTLGLDAGRQPPPGLYVADRVFEYEASLLRDRDGDMAPVQGLDASAFADGIGVATTFVAPLLDTTRAGRSRRSGCG